MHPGEQDRPGGRGQQHRQAQHSRVTSYLQAHFYKSDLEKEHEVFVSQVRPRV